MKQIAKSIKLGIASLFLFNLSFCTNAENKSNNMPKESIYNIELTNINGDKIDLNAFKGKKILFVNVASECGFTPQYEDLQKLHETYSDKLVVIGLPCNQFGGQEPGNAEEIQTFCKKNYGVTFLLAEKLDVKGENQHALYKWLTEEDLNGVASSSVKWNFQKYLINEDGNYVDVFYSATNPMSEDITNHLK